MTEVCWITETESDDKFLSFSGQRFLKIAKSPMAAALAFPYAITTAGIQLTSDEVYDAEDGLTVIRNESEWDPDPRKENEDVAR